MSNSSSESAQTADHRPSRPRRQSGHSSRPSLLAIAATLAYVGIVFWFTLGPAPWTPTRMSEAPLGILNPMTWLAATTWTTGSPAEFALNIALFVGALAGLLIGVGLTMRKRPPKGLSMLSDSAMTNQQPGTARRAKV